MKRKRGAFNPYLPSYLCLAMFCCVVISVLFIYINLENMTRKETAHNQEKITLIAEDLEKQLEIFQKVSVQIRANDIYRPFYFERNKYYEYVLLNDFVKYRNYSPLVNEYFLYYSGKESVFHSEANTTDLDLFLKGLAEEDAPEVRCLLDESERVSLYPLKDCFIALFPIVISPGSGSPDAVLCVIFRKDDIRERIQAVSGGLSGGIALCFGDTVLYESGEWAGKESSNILSAQEEFFTVRYRQNGRRYGDFGILPLEIMMVVAVMLLMVFIASLFAWHSWKPIIRLSQKYSLKIPAGPGERVVGKLEEIDYMLKSMIEDNAAAGALLEQKQEQLRKQLLLLLLTGKHSDIVRPYLTQAELPFPGKWFFVVSVSFREDIGPEIPKSLCDMLESLTDPQEDIYVYTIGDSDRRTIHGICSVSERIQWEEVCIDIQEMAESFEQMSAVGCGNICDNLNSIPASYLEALDNMENRKNRFGKDANTFEISGENEILYRIRNCMAEGEAEAALDVLGEYVEMLREKGASLLMRQYLFMEFLGEMNRIFREYRMEMSKQPVSMIISAKDFEQFKQSAVILIRDFCTQLGRQKEELSKNESYRILQYVNEHFTDYEISIENVAQEMNTNVMSVRNAIKEHTDKNYKDYLISLRMEYAKELLVKEKLTVAQTCQRIGYGNISYFIKAFKEHTGVTPAYYKKIRGQDKGLK